MMKSRLDGVCRWLQRNRREEDLFSAACLVGEMLAGVHGGARVAHAVLDEAARANGLREALGRERVQRTIANGLRHVESKMRKPDPACTQAREVG